MIGDRFVAKFGFCLIEKIFLREIAIGRMVVDSENWRERLISKSSHNIHICVPCESYGAGLRSRLTDFKLNPNTCISCVADRNQWFRDR